MSSMQRAEKHKVLYKSTGPHWKDTYRKRCQERLKKNRDVFMQRFRKQDQCPLDQTSSSMVEDMMVEEWKLLQNEDPRISNVSFSNFCEVGCRSIDDYLSVFQEIRDELIIEERRILEEYEAGLKFDEAALCATIDCLTTDQVICPMCSKCPLFHNRGVIFCNCGLRIDTEQDCITLANVKENLEFGSSHHSAVCQEKPSFSVMNQIGFNNLLMTCSVCDFMYVVI